MLRTIAASLIFSFSQLSGAPQPSGPTLNINKFQLEAESIARATLGDSNFKALGPLRFRDGAGPLDYEPINDYAAFYQIIEINCPILNNRGFQLAYRLRLSGELELILRASDGWQGYSDASFTDLLGMFNEYAAEVDIKLLVSVLQAKYPEATFELILGMLLVSVESSLYLSVMRDMHGSPLMKQVELSYENYLIPFQFEDEIIVDETGTIEADQYRTLTKIMKESGVTFSTKTTVPKHLQ